MKDQLEDLFDKMNGLRVLVIGDVMADAYIRGKVERISPEAPVPVLHTKTKEVRLGGAANVALNLRALGIEVKVCARVGKDEMGEEVLHLLKKENIGTDSILQTIERPTTVKTRIIAGGQHLLRLDEENDSPTFESEKEALIDLAIKGMENVHAIVFEDYDKGAVFPELIQQVVEKANAHSIPVLVDPKKRNFSDFKGVTLFKPNLKELKEGLKIDLEPSNLAEVETACIQLSNHLDAKGILLTLSEHGMALWSDGRFHYQPAMPRDIADVSGAGDTVIALATACLAAGCSNQTTLQLANLAGGLVCEYSGVVPVDKKRLLAEAKEMGLSGLDI